MFINKVQNLMVIISLTSLGPDNCVMVGVLLGLKSLHSLGPIHASQYSAPGNEKNAVKMKPKTLEKLIRSVNNLLRPSLKVSNTHRLELEAVD